MQTEHTFDQLVAHLPLVILFPGLNDLHVISVVNDMTFTDDFPQLERLCEFDCNVVAGIDFGSPEKPIRIGSGRIIV